MSVKGFIPFETLDVVVGRVSSKYRSLLLLLIEICGRDFGPLHNTKKKKKTKVVVNEPQKVVDI